MRVLLPLLFALAQCRTPPAAVDKAGLPMGRPWKYDRGIVTTCGVGTASHNAGRWKPRRLFDGVGTMAWSVRNAGSKLPIVFVSFSEEPGAHAECLGDATLRAGAVDCVQLNASYAMLRGYGYSKIVAVLGAPVREVLWVDADCWFVGDPSRLFYDEAYLRAGAAFWPDFFGYFGEDESLWTKLGGAYGYGLRGRQCDEGGDVRWYSCANPKCNLRHNCSTDAGLEQCACPDALGDPRSHWDAVQGFDSGLFLVDKARHAQPLRRLARLADLKDAAHWDFAWYSHDQGDKDLWHLAWLLERANYTLAPLNGVVASKSTHSAGKLGLVSQAKMDAFGRVIALHQNWRPLAAAASVRPRARYRCAKGAPH
ncbi:hypothetical protein M885DRAFT_534047 [Pelagophyceae sp. CCMP2097]|nr:hypothetical protein M885DRAFT_534047 [Pelagophyceae sp. CCMP2097]